MFKIRKESKFLIGIKLAAKKRLKFETNIDVDDINQFLLVEKIFYESQSCEIWGENEGKKYRNLFLIF